MLALNNFEFCLYKERKSKKGNLGEWEKPTHIKSYVFETP